MPVYYFDVLPLRPYPETFESLTSYLMRLAEKNGLHRFSSLHDLIAVTAYSTSQLTDYSFSFLKVLADRVNCSESRLNESLTAFLLGPTLFIILKLVWTFFKPF